MRFPHFKMLVNCKILIENLKQDSNKITLEVDQGLNFEYQISIDKDTTTLSTKLELPNTVYIKAQSNFLIKEFWLGNIKSSNWMLSQIILDTSWPNTKKIEIFDPSFIDFHLHYNNIQ